MLLKRAYNMPVKIAEKIARSLSLRQKLYSLNVMNQLTEDSSLGGQGRPGRRPAGARRSLSPSTASSAGPGLTGSPRPQARGPDSATQPLCQCCQGQAEPVPDTERHRRCPGRPRAPPPLDRRPNSLALPPSATDSGSLASEFRQ